VPGITGNGLPAGVLEDTTFPQADNSMSLAEAIQMVWANAGYSKEGKTVRFVQFDQGAIEDFFVQVMPVRDQKTGEEYVELFFRPLEPHADKLFESLIAAPPDESVGQWVVPGWPRDTEDVHPSDLAIGDVIAVRRGPNGQLSSWGGNGTFGTARVISGTRVVGQDSEGYDIVEFDVMLPNGKPATIIQQSNWDYVQRAEWMVTDEAGEQRRLGERRPHQLSEEAFAADWRLVAQHVSSQVRHQSQAFEGDGVKVIDTDAAFNGAQLGTPPNSGVTLARKLGDNTKLWLSLHTPKSKRREEENNFGRSIYIQVPRREFEGGTTEDIARSVSAAMEAVGITPQQQALPTDAALSEWALNTIGQHFGANPDFVPQTGTSDVGPLMPGRKWNQEQVEELLRTEVSPKVGRDVTLEDFEFVVAPDGRLMVAATQKLAEDLSAQSGTVSLRHESDMAWAHTPEERVLMMADRIAGVLGGEKSADNQGPAGRAATGVWAFGQSSDTDMWNGAGNRFYFWTHRDDPPPSAPESGFHILIDDEIFQRFLGNGMSTDDNYGRRTQKEGVAYPILAWTSTQGSPDHNEATVKYGLDSTLIEAIKVPDDLYEGVLREVRRHGITEVGGRPIEEILVPSSQLISMKDRRKTRQVRPNGGFFPGAGNVWTTVQNSKAVPAQKNSAGGPVPGPSELGEMVEPSAEDLAGLEAELVAEVEAGVPG
jgi:hypothetical protein